MSRVCQAVLETFKHVELFAAGVPVDCGSVIFLTLSPLQDASPFNVKMRQPGADIR